MRTPPLMDAGKVQRMREWMRERRFTNLCMATSGWMCLSTILKAAPSASTRTEGTSCAASLHSFAAEFTAIRTKASVFPPSLMLPPLGPSLDFTSSMSLQALCSAPS